MSNPITIKLITPDGTQLLEISGTIPYEIYSCEGLEPDYPDVLTVTVDKVITTELFGGQLEAKYGTGMDHLKCPECKGSGDIPDCILDYTKKPPREVMVFPPCDTCKGTGERLDD